MGRKVKVQGKATVYIHAWIDAPEDESIDDTITRVANQAKNIKWEQNEGLVVDKKSLDIREEINTKDET